MGAGRGSQGWRHTCKAVLPPASMLAVPGCTTEPVSQSPFLLYSTGMQYYQQYAQLLIERINTVNGRVYKDDPTIWCGSDCWARNLKGQ